MRAINLEKLLPADIPPGERVLWFGRPEATSLWRRAYRADWVAAWFVVMTAWNFVFGNGRRRRLRRASSRRCARWASGARRWRSWRSWLGSAPRTTLYVVTERRVVIKTGIALPIFINVPFKQIGSANVGAFATARGDVPVALIKGQRIPYLALWPSARPLRFAKSGTDAALYRQRPSSRRDLGPRLAEASGQAPQPPAPARRRKRRAGVRRDRRRLKLGEP